MKIRIIIVLALISTASLFGQKVQVAKADKQYDKFAYIDAIEIYERVADKGYESPDVFKKLGNAYYFNAELDKASKWYGKLMDLGQEIEPEYYFRYSQTLKSIGEYTKANEMLEKFNQSKGGDSRAQKYEAKKNYLEIIEENSGRHSVENAGAINSKYSDYGSAFFGEQLVFASARDTGGIFKRKHKWTNQSFTNLYQSKVGSDGNLQEADKFSKATNSKFHESTPVFTKDGQTMYFTRNNYVDGKKGKSGEKVMLLKILKATLVDDKWENVVELPFNSNEYSVAHPALSPDDKTLYFASDMPGTLGASDLYKVAINGDSYGEPENLGPVFNTEARETFPFMSDENELYFASDGQLGLGGLDIFVSKMEEDGTFKEIHNVGAPVNGKNDDFALLIDTQTKFGFFTSNRDGGQGYDDIYKFKENIPLPYKCEQTLEIAVVDQETAEVIPNAQITLMDENMQAIEQVFADENGKHTFNKDKIECDKDYTVRVTGINGYSSNEKPVHTAEKTGETFVEIPLEKNRKQITTGTDLAKTFGIEMIYFDLDKSNIRKDAAAKLAIIVEVMIDNPNIKIDVRSHTDCRQTYDYNIALSDRRAKSTINWLVKKGIAKNRLTGRGYGESKLVNDCGCEPTNDSTCTEEEHQKNRRSEFIIVEM
jgi:outer membrane protein OmpA-like peptidoglycan-associated protein/tetratricopeptide (TPR) repeat protein